MSHELPSRCFIVHQHHCKCMRILPNCTCFIGNTALRETGQLSSEVFCVSCQYHSALKVKNSLVYYGNRSDITENRYHSLIHEEK